MSPNPALLTWPRPVAGGGAWGPSDLTGLAAWYDAADAATITHSLGAVSAWSDKSSNGYTLTQPTASAKPTTGTATRNDLNVLAFDGRDRLVAATAADWTFLHDGTDVLIGVVFVPSSAATMTLVDTGGIGAATFGAGVTFLNSMQMLHRVRQAPSTTIVGNSSGSGTATAAWHAVTLLSDVDNETAASRSRFWVDGSGPYANNTTTGAPSLTAPPSPLTVGAEANAATPLTGSIAEIVIALSADTNERASLATYLASKWGIS